MSLFPDEDIATKEIESWKSFADALREPNRSLFLRMLKDCQKYSSAMNAKGGSFPTESMLMAIALHLQKMTDELNGRYGAIKNASS